MTMAATLNEQDEEDDDDDCASLWDAFASDTEDDDDNDNGKDDDDERHSKHAVSARVAEQVCLWLTKHFVQWNPQIPLSQRRVHVDCHCPHDTSSTNSSSSSSDRNNGDENNENDNDDTSALLRQQLQRALDARGMQRITKITHPAQVVDAAVLFCMDTEDAQKDDNDRQGLARRNVVPNGVLLMVQMEAAGNDNHHEANDGCGKIVSSSTSYMTLDERVWGDTATIVNNTFHCRVDAAVKHACPINREACAPWLGKEESSTHSVVCEQDFVSHATVTPSARDIIRISKAAFQTHDEKNEDAQSRRLTHHDLERARACLQQYGYCIVRHLVDPIHCCTWGRAILADLQEACAILQERNGIHLKTTVSSTRMANHQSKDDDASGDGGTVVADIANNYRELAMREDLRMDLRDGPHLQRVRRDEAKHFAEWGIAMEKDPNMSTAEDQETTTTAETTPAAVPPTPIVTTSAGSSDSCLRFHPDVLEIARRTMNPRDAEDGHEQLYRGNFGRYNFDGSGPDGSYQPLRIGPTGGIVSLPGAADQAVHADTPHLFEHLDCLPAHYINAFCLGIDMNPHVEVDADGGPTGSTKVGGTAFVHGSHTLSFTAKMETEPNNAGREDMLRHLVRPSLEVGDVVLFDCRVLHFGLANHSKDVERPLLYTNMTHAWFHDPKNWNNRQSIFEPGSCS